MILPRPTLATAILPALILSAFASEPQIPLLNDVSSPLDASRSIAPTAKNWTSAMLDFHRRLVGIESTTGHEHEVGVYLKSFLESHNYTTITQDLPPLDRNPHKSTRFNVYAFNGRSPKSNILVTSHMDTVPPYYNYTMKDGNEIWGRGCVDAKGSIAAQVTATLALLDEGKIGRGDVSLLFVVGEEVDGLGMTRANDLNLHWKAGIFGEPTELKLVSGHKGMLSGEIKAQGKAAHSGYPWLGESANSKLIRAMAIFDAMALGYSEKYGNTTINIGRIDAGVAANVVPESAKAYFAIRTAVDEVSRMKKEIVNAIGDEVDVNFAQEYGPVDCDADVDGFETMTVNYGTDVPWLQRKRLQKRYLYGPGSIFVAHSDHEHLNVKDLEAAMEGYKKLILHSLKDA